MLDGDSRDVYNDMCQLDRVTPIETDMAFDHGVIELPPHSPVMVQVQRA